MAEFGIDRLESRRRVGVVALLVGVVCMAALIVALNIIDARLDRIERDGQSISAEVVATEGRGESGTITIEFRSPAGERTEVVQLDGGSPDYEVGQRLLLKVNGTDPAEFVVPGEQNLSQRTSSMLSLLTVVALIALGIGLVLLVTSWWLGRRGRSRSARADYSREGSSAGNPAQISPVRERIFIAQTSFIGVASLGVAILALANGLWVMGTALLVLAVLAVPLIVRFRIGASRSRAEAPTAG